jgi:hypothetical protein
MKKPKGDLIERWDYTYKGVKYELELEIDRRRILGQLGPRAVQNTGKKASQIAGAVIVRVVGTK